MQSQHTRVIAQAPAKINLFLEVLGRRADGFHEIETVMTKIRLYDTLIFENDPTGRVSFQWTGPLGRQATGEPSLGQATIPSDATNLVVKAIELLRSHTGERRGARLRLKKRIPSAAGLGGGSSDAAAALLAANQGWQLGLQREELHQLAEQLGSDVPFFLYSSTAVCRGRGEIVQPIRLSGQLHLVVMKPPVELSTAKVYNSYKTSQRREVLSPVTQLQHVRDVRLFNRLQAAAETLTPWITEAAKVFTQLGVPRHQMTGSGSAYFGICDNARKARRIASRLRQSRQGDVFCTSACT